MTDLLVEDPPEQKNEKTLHTWNVGRLKTFLDSKIDYRLRTPIYHLSVKYFDSEHPILLNYKSRWGEYLGKVHCVCISHIIEMKSFPLRIPIRNNHKPIETVRELRQALDAFDDSLFLVLCYLDSNLQQLSSYTFCDAYEIDAHECGSSTRYMYSDDGQFIIGVERLFVPKIEFDFPFVSLCWYEPKANVIFTNVSRHYATSLRDKVKQQYDEFMKTL
jgi:hypothetical protein